jgi:hypothetical protein
MHKSATKCNKTISKWYKNKHGASKIIDTFETYQWPARLRFDSNSAKFSSMAITMGSDLYVSNLQMSGHNSCLVFFYWKQCHIKVLYVLDLHFLVTLHLLHFFQNVVKISATIFFVGTVTSGSTSRTT